MMVTLNQLGSFTRKNVIKKRVPSSIYLLQNSPFIKESGRESLEDQSIRLSNISQFQNESVFNFQNLKLDKENKSKILQDSPSTSNKDL